MVNPLLALQPAQGVRDTGNAILNASQSIQNGLLQNRQNKIQDTQLNQQNQLFGQTKKSNQLRLDRETGQMLYNSAISLRGMNDPNQRAQALGDLTPKLLELGMNEAQIADGLDDGELDFAINALSRFKPQTSNAQIDAFVAKAEAAGLAPGSQEFEKAALIELGMVPRASTSASERIATDSSLGDAIVTQAQREAGAKEGAKLEQQLKHRPNIAAAIKTAEDEAKSRGETLTSLNRSKAAMPGLMEAVEELKELAPLATSTIGGKIWDQAVKQTGFGSTEGATARAKFIAIIDNQVLPLLKETFGAAFTEQEGEALRKTMGDPDGSPEEKLVQLDAFIAQKQRDIQSKENELGQTSGEQLDPSLLELMSPEERALFK